VPGVEINRIDRGGKHALSHAIEKSSLPLVELLLNHPDLCLDQVGVEAKHELLRYACEVNSVRLFQLLLQSGQINLNRPMNKTFPSPLFLALRNQALDVAKLLLQHLDLNINLYLGQQSYFEKAFELQPSAARDDLLRAILLHPEFRIHIRDLNKAIHVGRTKFPELILAHWQNLEGLNSDMVELATSKDHPSLAVLIRSFLDDVTRLNIYKKNLMRQHLGILGKKYQRLKVIYGYQKKIKKYQRKNFKKYQKISKKKNRSLCI